MLLERVHTHTSKHTRAHKPCAPKDGSQRCDGAGLASQVLIKLNFSHLLDGEALCGLGAQQALEHGEALLADHHAGR